VTAVLAGRCQGCVLPHYTAIRQHERDAGALAREHDGIGEDVDQDLLRGRSQAQHIDDELHARCHKAEVTRGEWRLYGVSIVPG
jgi:hypothetical protein